MLVVFQWLRGLNFPLFDHYLRKVDKRGDLKYHLVYVGNSKIHPLNVKHDIQFIFPRIMKGLIWQAKSKNKCHGLEREFLGNEKFSLLKTSKTPLSNQLFWVFVHVDIQLTTT